MMNNLRLASSRSSLRKLVAPNRFKSTAEKVVETTAPEATTTTSTNSVPVAQSLLAAVIGVGTVSATAAVVEMTSPAPQFDPQAQRFDQSHFAGRFSRMLLACDPRLLFYTETQVRQAHKMVQNYQEYDESMNRALWEAKRIVDAALHPDTGDVIPRPFRMSG